MILPGGAALAYTRQSVTLTEAPMLQLPKARILPFGRDAWEGKQRVGRVHRDGSITFRGTTYRTLKEVPAECVALRADLDTYRQWRALYRAVNPSRREAPRPSR